jgi:hypothetical protein
MIKNLVIFQVKLAFDAIRDLLLSPVSFICTVIDIFNNNNDKNSLFKRLMDLGHKTDVWLNLFGYSLSKEHAKNQSSSNHSSLFNPIKKPVPEANVDQLFDKIEGLIREQHAKGGLTASAKATLDGYLDKISKKSPAKNNVVDETLISNPVENNDKNN